jgi:2-iminobutanoate/2-iminopropanoate deaminase
MKQKLLVAYLLLSSLCSANEIPHFDQILDEQETIRASLSVETETAPRPGGSYYSQALYVPRPREILFIAGQLPIDPATNTVIMDPTLATHRCMLNIQALLTNAGMDFSNLKKVIIAVTNMDDVRTICGVYASYLTTPPFPTLSVIGVASLPLGSVVGIEGMAVA